MSGPRAFQPHQTVRREAVRRDAARHDGVHHDAVHARHSADPRRPGGNRVSAGGGYTIAHAGRQIRFGPVAFWIAVGTVVIMAGWSAATATYFAFRDDVLRNLIARQTEQQFAYEDRIAELRAQIDRSTSRQLLDQEQFEQKLDELVRRQKTLESRAGALNTIADPTPTGSIKGAAHAGDLTDAAKSSSTSDTLRASQRFDRATWLDPSRTSAAEKVTKVARLEGKLAGVEASLDRLERHQVARLREMEERYEGKAQRMRGVLSELGLRLEAPTPSAVGGPFVPVKLNGTGNSFDHALVRANLARAQADQLDRALVWVPVRKPVEGELDQSSGFGVRADPFLHMPSMHTGLDFRGEMGEPIHATAAGRVTTAGWSGGYGKMVEVDHGNGLATRYGHLSQINVSVGDRVRPGQIVGHMGSTGRSTGPHLHYETRVDGEAVDPHRFLRAGVRLSGG